MGEPQSFLSALASRSNSEVYLERFASFGGLEGRTSSIHFNTQSFCDVLHDELGDVMFLFRGKVFPPGQPDVHRFSEGCASPLVVMRGLGFRAFMGGLPE